LVVLDSEADLRRVAALLPGARVLIRVNPDLPVATHPHLATGKGESQFGVLPEAVPRLMGLAQALGLHFLGLHLHLRYSRDFILHGVFHGKDVLFWAFYLSLFMLAPLILY